MSECQTKAGNQECLENRTPKIDLLSMGPDGPDQPGSSGGSYRRTVTGPNTEPRQGPETGPTSNDVLEWFP